MLDTEKLMPLADAAKIALGFDKHKSTIYRWATKGLRGASGRRVFLNDRRIGGELMCTIQDVREFDVAINARIEVPRPVKPTAGQRQYVKDRLKALGLT
ncbi:hypothetical protein VN12_01495 [Pirellula sp. SH-Sr6A]|uniref:DUF1580 domain-containing protein n=1 Tax=Pirellula sp. SH-Sr6A TaxID=1632865 RepID=UPI00078B9011|nr:DUF1580 domain-containing protein [Pirellula sp. SH-Sr6A]AMV30760.1 hypothetical protein VN12_01495 [Pirellula sp. SH-Sr6A]